MSDAALPDSPNQARSSSGAADRRSRDVIVLKEKKKKKRKYSRGTKALQRLSLGSTRALSRLGKGAEAGFGDLWDRTNKSSRKRRDGAIRDGLKNWARAYDKFARKSSRAPYDFVRELGTQDVRRQYRSFIRAVSPFLFLR